MTVELVVWAVWKKVVFPCDWGLISATWEFDTAGVPFHVTHSSRVLLSLYSDTPGCGGPRDECDFLPLNSPHYPSSPSPYPNDNASVAASAAHAIQARKPNETHIHQHAASRCREGCDVHIYHIRRTAVASGHCMRCRTEMINNPARRTDGRIIRGNNKGKSVRVTRPDITQRIVRPVSGGGGWIQRSW